MTFSNETKAELAKPLNKAHVKPPAPGKYGDYIEGWRVIDEANRIFGFDGWHREITVKMLGEPREVGGKWRVDYIASARITVGNVIRDGHGFGQGIDKDIGQAHESALKEAETDAMKRALMTFGNPFGLALYDKTQSNVASLPPAKISEAQKDVLITMLEQSGADVGAFLGYYEIKVVDDLPAGRFDEARRQLDKKLKKKEAA